MAFSFYAYLRDRLFEWVMTVSMVGIGIEIFLYPPAVSSSAFRLMLTWISSENLGAFFLGCGVLRMMALVANGAWPRHGPKMRVVGSGLAAIMWAQIGVALSQAGPVPGVPLYLALSVGELISAYRATSDARHPR